MSTATLYMDEDCVTLLETDDIIAVRQGGRVEVWDSDGCTHYGNLPENVTGTDVVRYIQFYERGRTEGIAEGRETAKVIMRAALGL